jgi:hypothetical protein
MPKSRVLKALNDLAISKIMRADQERAMAGAGGASGLSLMKQASFRR